MTINTAWLMEYLEPGCTHEELLDALPRGALGMPLPSVAAIAEYLVVVNVLPNRPDFLGLIGIARDVAALLRLKLRYPQTFSPSSSGAKGRDAVVVEVREPELCPRYMCRVV